MIIFTGLILGVFAAYLSNKGNPLNAGIAPTCFIRDTAGALGLHTGSAFRYIRPEIIGLVLGSFIAALVFGEFRSRGGSSPLVRFLIGAVFTLGTLTFLGCPVRATIRLGGGDLNALIGFAGIATGVLIGIFFLNRGFGLSRTTTMVRAAGWIVPSAMIGLLLLAFFKPDFISYSEKGWGSEHAAIGLSLVAVLLIGFLAQRTRICFAAAWRDLFLIRDTYLMTAVVAAFLGALFANLILGQFKLGFLEQPHVHSNHLWNFLGTILVGLGATLLTGCPLRQLILSGEGDTDAGMTVLGIFAGSAIARNFNLSSCGGHVSELTPVAVFIGLAVCVATGFLIKEK
jgi:YedE family putative selenium metabolism protein